MSEEQTGIFIRAKIGERWESVDIADARLPDDQLIAWLRSDPQREMAVRVCLILLGRVQGDLARRPPPDAGGQPPEGGP